MGVDVDLAPVADVPAAAGSFLGTRAFGHDGASVRRHSIAFARGLQAGRVAATAKHYPGLGHAGPSNTDTTSVVIDASAAALAAERAVFRAHARAGTKLVMVSNATYDAYDRHRPAVLSRSLLTGLRRQGFGGVTISDDMHNPAVDAYGRSAARLATLAGIDVLLYASTDGSAAFDALLDDARAGRIPRSVLDEQVKRVIALKQWLAAD